MTPNKSLEQLTVEDKGSLCTGLDQSGNDWQLQPGLVQWAGHCPQLCLLQSLQVHNHGLARDSMLHLNDSNTSVHSHSETLKL